MGPLLIGLVVAVALALRIWQRLRRRRRAAASASDASDAGTVADEGTRTSLHQRPALSAEASGPFGDVGLVALREINERVRGRLFQGGTVVVLLVVVAAVVIPSIHSSSPTTTTQTVAITGPLSPEALATLHLAATSSGDDLRIVRVRSVQLAEQDLRAERVDVAIIGGRRVLLKVAASASNAPADPTFVQQAAAYLGVLNAYRSAGLTPAQLRTVLRAHSLPVHTLVPSPNNSSTGTAIIGLILLFFMLTQYCTWILMGVMQEKSSRVAEVLLATLRPVRLLSGKVLGIGLMALAQATLVVGTALIAGAAVGSDVLKGTGTLLLLTQLLWLLLGYAFYCWVYAAAGSTAERQDQIQTLALPLSIPILIGYLFSITVAASGSPDLLFRILAYVPPTAPFCMPVLVELHLVTWWQFTASVLITIASTFAMARIAASIYRRAILRTGGRARILELLRIRAA